MDILADPEKGLKGLFFQDLEMQRKYKAYPEMISVNATYKLLEIRMPVYLILNEDAMGENARESEIVAVCFLAEENAEGIGFLLIHLINTIQIPVLFKLFGHVECVSKILKRQTQLNVICVLNGTTANKASKNEILVL